jgi:hypothetical protein
MRQVEQMAEFVDGARFQGLLAFNKKRLLPMEAHLPAMAVEIAVANFLF